MWFKAHGFAGQLILVKRRENSAEGGFAGKLTGNFPATEQAHAERIIVRVCKNALVEFEPSFKASKKSSVVVSISRLHLKNSIGLVRTTRSCLMRVLALLRSQNRAMTSAQVRVIILGACADR